MVAYWIARINVTDPATYEEYRARGPAAIAKYGGQILVRAGPYRNMEGPDYERNVMVRFESLEQAVACYESPEYQEAVKFRARAAESQFFIVQGE